MAKQERRILKMPLSIRKYNRGKADESQYIEGYAATFNRTTLILDFHERIAETAFDNALRRRDDVRFLVNHGGIPLARTKGGTLNLNKDDKGLYFTAELPNTALGNEIAEAVNRGVLNEMSFAFRVDSQDWDDQWTCDDEDCPDYMQRGVLRTVTDLHLFDVSAVTFPAYPGTSAKSVFVEDLSKIGQPDDQDTGELDGTNVKSGDDDDDFDPTEYMGILVPAEVRAKATSLRRAIRRAGDPDEAWFADASRRVDAADLDRADAKRRQRLAAMTQQIRLSDVVEELDLRSQAARDIAFAEDVAYTKRVAGWLRHPHTFPGTCEEFLRFQDQFQAKP